MLISIIICSWKAPSTLNEALASVYQQKTSTSFEVILVNNGFSADRAAQILESFPGVILVDEPRSGLSHARQRGFGKATGDFFVCIDDDNLLGEHFLDNLSDLIGRHPNLGCICPDVLPIWEETPPLWLQEFGSCCLSYSTFELKSEPECGSERIWSFPDLDGWITPPGGGMIIHRSLAEDYLREDDANRIGLGRRGGRLGGGEDMDIYFRFIKLKKNAAYSGRLLVFHKIPAYRLRFSYLMKLNFHMMQDCAVLERIWIKEKDPIVRSGVLEWHRMQVIRLPIRWMKGKIRTELFMLEYARHVGFLWGWFKDLSQGPIKANE